jgi:NAD(P)-dependent dehydrogenase (short-subunit alcohol dehydrogenase family)
MRPVAVITGGARGIGHALAEACVAEGIKPVVADLVPSPLRGAVSVDVDVRDPAAWERLRRRAFRAGQVEYVFLNAGVAIRREIQDMRPADWDFVLGVNLHGVINGVATFLPALEKQGSGHIQATASFHGNAGDPEFAGYCVSKFGVVALMETLHRELRRRSSPVGASVLCPGSTITDLMHNALDQWRDEGGGPDGDDAVRSERVHHDLQRGITATAVARMALDGIRSGRFWIFTHPYQVDDYLRARFEALARDGSLPPLPWSS